MAFVYDKGFTYEPIKGLLFPVNVHDHFIYVEYMDNIMSATGGYLLNINNNTGIAIVYIVVTKFLDAIGLGISIDSAALLVNLSVFFLALLSYYRIIGMLKLPKSYVFLFYLNVSFIYFAQLINKDSFTILIFFKLIEYSLYKNHKRIFLLFLFSFFIRVQLPLFIIVYLLLTYKCDKNLKRLAFLYIVFALVSGYLSNYQSLIMSEETLGGGFSYIVHKLNSYYYVGSLILNPLRVLQYFYDLILSFDFYNLGYVDVSRLKNIPQVIMFILLSPYVFLMFFYYEKNMKTPARYLMAAIVSFFLVWLLNPMINVRYILLILPVVILLGFYKRNFRYNEV